MDVCFCCSGKRLRKRGERFAKGLNTTIYTKYAHENMIIIPCTDSAGARKGAKGSRKRGVKGSIGEPMGTIILNNPLKAVFLEYVSIEIRFVYFLARTLLLRHDLQMMVSKLIHPFTRPGFSGW